MKSFWHAARRTLGLVSPTRAIGDDSDSLAEAEDQREILSPPAQRAAAYRVAAGRETIEAFVVAFILALLFRAFLAEAFVIPTGSMAPALMGAHKDVFCDQCQQRFQLGASQERVGPRTEKVVVAGVCPNCRHINSLDLVNDSNEATFNGDRIVVNKFAYAINEPERWDVIVFKFPGNPKQNYIKRLVGLPNETVTLRTGNVYVSTTGTDETPAIVRRDPETRLAMSHLVNDTDHQSASLIAADYPSRWQPWKPGATQPPEESWVVQRTADAFIASLDAEKLQGDGAQKWLRYFNHWPNDLDWDNAAGGGSLSNVDPYMTRAITDFYAYDSSIDVPAYEVYDQPPSLAAKVGLLSRIGRLFSGGYSNGEFSPDYVSGGSMNQFRRLSQLDPMDKESVHGVRDGMHWVGELMVTADIETDDNAKSVVVELVKAGIQFQCTFDLASATASLRIVDGDRELPFESGQTPVAQTAFYAGDSVSIRISNYDNEIGLWIDDDYVEFDTPTTYAMDEFREPDQNRPHWTSEHPLDGSPVGIAVVGGGALVDRLMVHRDQYYIATRQGDMDGNTEYSLGAMWQSITGSDRYTIQSMFGRVEQWDQFDWSTRQTQTYVMQADQFFPLGDNSPGSLDARSWAGTKPRLPLPLEIIEPAWKWRDTHYVPRDLLVGKAVAIFWPHSWNAPIPITPNVSRMKLIK